MAPSDQTVDLQIPFPPTELVPITSYVTTTIACLIIGLTFSVILYGMSLVQTQVYFLRYHRHDPLLNKILVAVLWALDTLCIILVAQSLYHMVVLQYGNPVQAAIVPWTLIAESETVSVITFLSHLFFTMQVSRAKGNRYVCSAIFVLSLVTLLCDLSVNIQMCLSPTRETLSSKSIQIFASTAQVALLLTDTSIMVALLYTFHSWTSKSISSITTDSIRILVIYSLSRGLVSCICQIVLLILYISFPDKIYWMPFHLVAGRIYVNSVLAALNARYRLQKQDIPERFPEFSTIAFHVKDRLSFVEDRAFQYNMSAPSSSNQEPSTSSHSLDDRRLQVEAT